MCKEIKRLILLADCAHINKTDRDAVLWAIQNLSPEQAETETSFGGWDFQAWPSVPDKKVFEELTKSRRAAKGGKIMTQAYIDVAAPHLRELVTSGVTVNEALKVATVGGWTSFKASWIINEIGKQEKDKKIEIKTDTECINLVMQGHIKHISDKSIPKNIRALIETRYRIGRYNPDVMNALEKIGMAI